VEAANGEQYPVVIDATGNTASMEASFENVAPGGRLVFVGLVSGPISFPDWLFHRREMTVLASRGSLNLFPQVIKMLEDSEIDVSSWVTHRMDLRDVPHHFAELRSHQITTTSSPLCSPLRPTACAPTAKGSISAN
jgi:threonine dehydrogenase-like Zn-dependent dehydrogenase